MKYLSSYISYLALAANTASALVVATGEHIDGNLNWSVAWKEGSSPCNEGVASLLAPIGANPCEHNLAADGKLCKSTIETYIPGYPFLCPAR
jgi:hypothetical protein